MRLRSVPPELMRKYVSDRLPDPEIASKFGVTTAAVWAYRRKHRIPTNKDRRLASVRRDVIEWLIERGLSDGEIGRIFRVSSAAVCSYRFDHAIVSKRAPRGRGWASC